MNIVKISLRLQLSFNVFSFIFLKEEQILSSLSGSWYVANMITMAVIVILVKFGDDGEDDEFENQIPSSSPEVKSLLLVSVFQLLLSSNYPPSLPPPLFFSFFFSSFCSPPSLQLILIFASTAYLAFYLSFMFRFQLHRGLLSFPFWLLLLISLSLLCALAIPKYLITEITDHQV